MGNLRQKYTDEEWDEIMNSPSPKPIETLKNMNVLIEIFYKNSNKTELHRFDDIGDDFLDGFKKGVMSYSNVDSVQIMQVTNE